MATEKVNVLEFSDNELNILNDIIRQHKVQVTNEELVLLAMGKRATPLIDLTVKIGSAWERRTNELQNPAPAGAALEVSESESAQN